MRMRCSSHCREVLTPEVRCMCVCACVCVRTAGAIAEKFLKQKYGVEIVSWVSAVGDLVLPDDKIDLTTLSREQV